MMATSDGTTTTDSETNAAPGDKKRQIRDERVTARIAAVSAAIAVISSAACGRTSPAPPTVQPVPEERVTGSERLGWDQRASDAAELATFRYVIYVDGARTDASEVSCGSTTSSAGFPCSTRLPAMSMGAHTLELATFIVDGSVLESSRSAPLRVNVTPAASAALETDSETRRPASWSTETLLTTRDGVSLHIERVADGLIEPTDLAFTRNGRLFIAELAGRLTVIHLNATPDETHEAIVNPGELLALALDPDFERTHFVYTVSTYEKGAMRFFQLARHREANDTFGDRVAILDGVPAPTRNARASLRFGSDGKLYVALDDGGAPDRAADLASTNGKVLRLNADGTTPADQAGATPVYSFPYHSPRGLDWQTAGAPLWIADVNAGRPRLTAIFESDTHAKRGSVRASIELPSPAVSSLAFYRSDRIAAFRGNLFVASDEGQHVLRIRFDPQQPTRVTATERLLQDRVGGVRAVAVSPDGAVYFCTADAIGRLVPDR